MLLEMDFEQRAIIAVFSEIASRSIATNNPGEVIHTAPITHHHFGGTCYYSKHHKRFAWMRTYLVDGKIIEDRLVVALGYDTPPETWKTAAHFNHMSHVHVANEVEAANMIVSFILDDSLPANLVPGDYHYYEHPMRG